MTSELHGIRSDAPFTVPRANTASGRSRRIDPIPTDSRPPRAEWDPSNAALLVPRPATFAPFAWSHEVGTGD
jgi:hypothetical protein